MFHISIISRLNGANHTCYLRNITYEICTESYSMFTSQGRSTNSPPPSFLFARAGSFYLPRHLFDATQRERTLENAWAG